MPSEGAASATHELLLQAAKRVMQRDGAGHLTLDAVAKEAGVSKGGLLYHFPSKGALLRGMVAHGGEHIRRDLEAQMRLSPGPKSFSRAFLKFSIFGPPESECKPPSEAVWTILGAMANDPSMLTPIQESQAEMGRRLAEEPVDPTVAQLIRLVGRGLWMSDIFGFEAPDETERQRLHDLLARMAGLDAGDEKDSMEEQ